MTTDDVESLVWRPAFSRSEADWQDVALYLLEKWSRKTGLGVERGKVQRFAEEGQSPTFHWSIRTFEPGDRGLLSYEGEFFMIGNDDTEPGNSVGPAFGGSVILFPMLGGRRVSPCDDPDQYIQNSYLRGQNGTGAWTDAKWVRDEYQEYRSIQISGDYFSLPE